MQWELYWIPCAYLITEDYSLVRNWVPCQMARKSLPLPRALEGDILLDKTTR